MVLEGQAFDQYGLIGDPRPSSVARTKITGGWSDQEDIISLARSNSSRPRHSLRINGLGQASSEIVFATSTIRSTSRWWPGKTALTQAEQAETPSEISASRAFTFFEWVSGPFVPAAAMERQVDDVPSDSLVLDSFLLQLLGQRTHAALCELSLQKVLIITKVRSSYHCPNTIPHTLV